MVSEKRPSQVGWVEVRNPTTNETCITAEPVVNDFSKHDLLFEAQTPLDFSVRVTRSYWKLIVTVKHPVMAGKESEVQEALENPEEIRLSRRDPSVYLFYKPESIRRWVCAVTKQMDGEAFLITTYPTDAIKEGVRVWPR